MRSAIFPALALITSIGGNAAENLSDHEQYCARAPEQNCLSYIEQNLAVLPKGSSSWFKVQSYLLDYLFDKNHFPQLAETTSQLLQYDSMPDGFAAQLYFYRAKTLYLLGEKEQARHFIHLTQQHLQSAFANFGTPIRLVELANLHYSLGEYTQADAVLNQAAQQFQKSKDPLFWFEWYANKALIADNQQQLALAEKLRQEGLKIALELGHSGKIIVAYGNLARTQQLLQQYAQAYANYQLSLIYMVDGTDDISKAVHLLRMAEISWQSGNFAFAGEHLRALNSSLLSTHHQQILRHLLAQPELVVFIADSSMSQ